MLNYSPESLHMAKVTCGQFFDFHLCLYSHCYVHGYELKNLWQKFTLKQKMQYYLRNFIYEFLLQIGPIKRFVNNRVIAILVAILYTALCGKRCSTTSGTSNNSYFRLDPSRGL